MLHPGKNPTCDWCGKEIPTFDMISGKAITDNMSEEEKHHHASCFYKYRAIEIQAMAC